MQLDYYHCERPSKRDKIPAKLPKIRIGLSYCFGICTSNTKKTTTNTTISTKLKENCRRFIQSMAIHHMKEEFVVVANGAALLLMVVDGSGVGNAHICSLLKDITHQNSYM